MLSFAIYPLLKGSVKLVALTVGVTAWGLAAPAAAQTYPTKPVTVIVPFAAGGSVDVLTRIITSHMAKTLGQSFVMDSVGGAGGTIGVAKGARSAPDGYTLVAGSSGSNAGAYSTYEKLSYTADSFSNIGIIAIIPALVVVKKDLPVHNLQELVAYSKSNPGKLSFGHPGVGSSVHLQCEFLKLATGIDMVLVPYKGAGALMGDLIGGQIDGACDAPPSSVGPVRNGMIRAIAVMGKERAASMPDVPTTVEQGQPKLQAPAWIGLFAPKNTPKSVLDRLEKALAAAMDDPDIQTRVIKLGANVPPSAQRGMKFTDEFIQTESAKWAELSKAAHIEKQ